MASPTYEDIWTYAHTVQGISQEARAAFLKAAESVDLDDWAAAADQLRDIITEIVEVYGLASGELGAQWYEYCRSKKYDSRYTAIVGATSRYGIVSDCDTVIDKLFDGKITTEEMVASLAGVVVNQVQKHARDTILDNLDIEYKAAMARGDRKMAGEIGYARVPMGDACAFCIMLASRGFVYRSEYTATKTKWGDKYHPNCTCEAVPFTQAGDIKGYGRKLDAYYETYADARDLWRSGNMPEELEKRIADARAEHSQKIAEGLASDRWGDDNEITIVMRWQNPGMH